MPVASGEWQVRIVPLQRIAPLHGGRVFSVGSWRQERRQRQSLPMSGTVPLPGAGAGAGGSWPLTAPVAGDAFRNSDEDDSFLWPSRCAQTFCFQGVNFSFGTWGEANTLHSSAAVNGGRGEWGHRGSLIFVTFL